jgi:hypothetical protein
MTPATGVAMKRFLALALCALALGAALASCGGSDYSADSAAKLTIVGAGS